MEKDRKDAPPTPPPPAQTPPAGSPPPRQRFACIVLIIASLTLAGLLIWATFSRGPMPPQASIEFDGSSISGSVEAGIYGMPTAVFFIEGDPQTKSSGEFDRLLPAVVWEKDDWLRILGIGYSVIWSAADPAIWQERKGMDLLRVEQPAHTAEPRYSFTAEVESLPSLEALRAGQTFCAIMLEQDKLLRVDAQFLQQLPIYRSGSTGNEADLDVYFTLNFRQDALTGSVSGAEALWPSGILLVQGSMAEAEQLGGSAATLIDEMTLGGDGRTLELGGQPLAVLWSALDPKAWDQPADGELEATQQQAGVTTYKFLARSDEAVINLLSANPDSRWVILLENSKAVALNPEIIRTLLTE